MAVTGKLPARRGMARDASLLPRAPEGRGGAVCIAAVATGSVTRSNARVRGAGAGCRGGRDGGGAGERPTGMRRAPVEDAAW